MVPGRRRAATSSTPSSDFRQRCQIGAVNQPNFPRRTLLAMVLR
jgi:hypothetical protein